MKTKKNLILLDFMGVAPEWNTWSQNWVYNDGIFCHISNADLKKALYSMAEYAKYSTSWDWLMPVVEKIESLGYDVFINGLYCRITDSGLSDFEIESSEVARKIEAVFSSCVEFAEWYKNQSKQIKA